MKLVRIEHSRCNEWAGTTFMWAPDEMTKEQLEAAVERAQTAYQAFIDSWREVKDNEPHNPGYRPDFKAFPDLTVREIEARFEKEKAEWLKWEKARQDTFKGFAEYLKAEGLTWFYDVEPELTTTVNWGHQHSKKIEYSDTMIDAGDFREAKHESF